MMVRIYIMKKNKKKKLDKLVLNSFSACIFSDKKVIRKRRNDKLC